MRCRLDNDVGLRGEQRLEAYDERDAVPRRERLALRRFGASSERDHDGLALSSRNVQLSPEDRTRAGTLHRALNAVRTAIEAGERDPESAARAGLDELAAAGIETDYLELVAADTLAPLPRIEGDVLVLIAARLGTTRLIDNQLLRTGPGPGGATDNGRP